MEIFAHEKIKNNVSTDRIHFADGTTANLYQR